MLKAHNTPIMLRPPADNVIPLPIREKPTEVLREAVAELYDSDLLPCAQSLLPLALEAAGRGDDADFYDRVKSAWLCLERILRDGGRI
jgi:hypothetical protein